MIPAAARMIRVVALAVLVGCQEAPSGPPVDPMAVDPCELVTTEEVEAAVGERLEPRPEGPGVGEARDCGFGTDIAPRVNVGIRRTPIEPGELRPFVDRFLETVPADPELRVIRRLGEEAYAIVLPGGEAAAVSHVTLFVQARGVLLSVSMNVDAPADEAVRAAEDLAAAALGQL